MTGPRHCAECGALLPKDVADDVCPACSFRGALALSRENKNASADSALRVPHSALGTLRYFGDYELLEEIARGGMGVVFKARQVSLNRTVAVKMILAGQLASEADVQRFRTEAEAAANLQHPNIVSIYEVGEHEGQHYFSMEYVEGKNLTDLVRENPLPAKRAAEIIKTIAEAIHYAHQRGTLHRDLKPSNVLIDQFGQPRVMDFGLAKRVGGTSSTSPHSTQSETLGVHPSSELELTVTGQVLGSPNFMPPEQCGMKSHRSEEARPSTPPSALRPPHSDPSLLTSAAPKAGVGPWSDVYGLGAILYHLLTSRPPFVADTIQATLAQVVGSEPASLRLLNPTVPRDLETICLKCLEKEPGKRYATANELSEELGRFGRGEPIHARPVSKVEKVWRWSARNPKLAGLSASVTALLVFIFVCVVWQLHSARLATEQDRQRLVRLNVANGVRLMDDGDLMASLPWFAQALKLDDGHPAQEEMHRLRLGSVLRRCPKLLVLLQHAAQVNDANFSPDGRRIVTASQDQTARVWDAASGEPITPLLQHGRSVRHASFSPDGKRVVTVGGNTIQVWDAATGQPLVPPMKHQFGVRQATVGSSRVDLQACKLEYSIVSPK